MNRPRLLIVSFSRLVGDARVLKQIRLFSSRYRVTTCGYGPKPEFADEHVELNPDELKATVLWRAALIRAGFYRAAYWSTPAVRSARARLRNRNFDAVLANDLDTAALSLSLLPSERIHLDLHEYWPGLHDNSPKWRRIRRPYYCWMLRSFATRPRSVTVVSDIIRRRYELEFGFQSEVVANASEFQEIEPSSVSAKLRLVHSGGSQPSRRIENMMKAVAETKSATLDLFLVGAGTDYYQSLVDLADSLGSRVRILPPVKPDELTRVLNRYDVGIHLLPPTNTNNELALPNKFFDYVQARIALVIGPTASMQQLLEQYCLGVVCKDFSIEALTEAIDKLTEVDVQRFKENAHRSARALSAGPQNEVWLRAIETIARTKGRDQ